MHYDALAAGGGAASGCTGTLSRPRRPHHRVTGASITDEGAACDGSGKAITGGSRMGDHDPAKIHVFGGATRPTSSPASSDPSRGKGDPPGVSTFATTTSRCSLDKPVSGATISAGAPRREHRGGRDRHRRLGISDQENNPETRKQRAASRRERVRTSASARRSSASGRGRAWATAEAPPSPPPGAVLGAPFAAETGPMNIGADALPPAGRTLHVDGGPRGSSSAPATHGERSRGSKGQPDARRRGRRRAAFHGHAAARGRWMQRHRETPHSAPWSAPLVASGPDGVFRCGVVEIQPSAREQ